MHNFDKLYSSLMAFTIESDETSGSEICLEGGQRRKGLCANSIIPGFSL